MRSDCVNQQLQKSSIRKALVDHRPGRRNESDSTCTMKYLADGVRGVSVDSLNKHGGVLRLQ